MSPSRLSLRQHPIGHLPIALLPPPYPVSTGCSPAYQIIPHLTWPLRSLSPDDILIPFSFRPMTHKKKYQKISYFKRMDCNFDFYVEMCLPEKANPSGKSSAHSVRPKFTT
jgi:hypothetical protein